MTISDVQVKDAGEWVLSGWENLKKQPLVMCGIYLLVAVFVMLPNMLGGLGTLVGSFLGPFIGAGSLLVADRLVHENEVEVKDFFRAFQDREIFGRLMPLALIFLGFGVLMFILGQLSSGVKHLPINSIQVLLSTVVLSVVSLVLTFFATPLVLFKKISWLEAIELSVKGFMQNLFPIGIYLGMSFGINLICTMTVILMLPAGVVILVANYFMFRSVFCKGETGPLVPKAEEEEPG